MKNAFLLLFILISGPGIGQGVFSKYIDIKGNSVQCNPPEIIKRNKIRTIKVWKTFLVDSAAKLQISKVYYDNTGKIVENGSCIDSVSNDTISYLRCDSELILYTIKQYNSGRVLKSWRIAVDKRKAKVDTVVFTTYRYLNDTVIRIDSGKSKTTAFTYNSKGLLIREKRYETTGNIADVEEMYYDGNGYLKKIVVSGHYPRKSVIKYRNHYREKTAYAYSYSGSLHTIQQYIYDEKGRLVEESRGSSKNETTYQKLVYFYSAEGLLDHVDDIRVKNGPAATRYIFEYEYY
jgi:hypothetical protein